MSKDLHDYLVSDGNIIISNDEISPAIQQRLAEAIAAPEVHIAK